MEEETMETTIPAFLTQNMNSSSSSCTSATTTTTTTTTSQEVQKSLHVLRRSRRRCMEGGKEVSVEEKDEDEDEGSDDREEIERKINALQRIVPNGESYGVDKLFDETAGYIVALQYQVKALKALTGFFQKMEKDKTKLGG
ncbi:transcription factor PAR1 [Vicia villosa]|uniref:transcription factor PAR1 n=1 Tax=Vicia villosa TaxID=3911 RepID=UPI00273B64E6|nr:transcription factor PAR1 [Vicia villosa]